MKTFKVIILLLSLSLLANAQGSFEATEGKRSMFSINMLTGNKDNTDRTFPAVQGCAERHLFNNLFNEKSPVSAGPIFGYSLQSNDISFIHQAYAGLNVTLHGLQATELIMKKDWAITKFIDPYITYAPSYVGVAESDYGIIGDVVHTVSFGTRLYFGNVGLDIAVGKVSPLNDKFRTGLVFRRGK